MQFQGPWTTRIRSSCSNKDREQVPGCHNTTPTVCLRAFLRPTWVQGQVNRKAKRDVPSTLRLPTIASDPDWPAKKMRYDAFDDAHESFTGRFSNMTRCNWVVHTIAWAALAHNFSKMPWMGQRPNNPGLQRPCHLMAQNNSHASGCLCGETVTGHLLSGFGNLEIVSCGFAERARRCCLTLQEVRDVTGHEQLPLHQAGRQHRRNLVSRFSPVDAKKSHVLC